MKRREFIDKILKAGLAVIAGVWTFAAKEMPRRFVRAEKMKTYPGVLKRLGKLNTKSKWGG